MSAGLQCFHLSPLAGRGRIAPAIRVRGTNGIFGICGTSPSPRKRGASEHTAGAEHLT